MKKYKTIGEVAKEVSVKTHTLRFWEKKFKQIKPKILFGERRYYSHNDVKLIKLIYDLLKNQGYTIEGANKLLKNSLNKLDDFSPSGIKKEDLKKSIKVKASKIKIIIDKIKKLENGKKKLD